MIRHVSEDVPFSIFGGIHQWKPLLGVLVTPVAGNDPEGAQILYLDCTQYINLYEIYVVAVNFKRQTGIKLRRWV